MHLHDLTTRPPIVIAIVTDVLAHGAITAISIVAGLVGIVCTVVQTWLKYRSSESFLSRYRLHCFRQWERARDQPPT
jgi:hypothetical protein